MARLKLGIAVDALRLAAPFRISSHVFDSRLAVLVTLDDGTHVGRGEATGVYYLGEDVESMRIQLEAARDAIEAHPTREELRTILGACRARGAAATADNLHGRRR